MLKPPTDKITAETREKLLALAEFIETDQRHGFWMGTYFAVDDEAEKSDRPECGTAGCIAGFCNLMLLGKTDPRKLREHDFEKFLNDDGPASDYLDLSPEQEESLFFPLGILRICNDRTKAVRVLRHFAYTGEVDWSV